MYRSRLQIGLTLLMSAFLVSLVACGGSGGNGGGNGDDVEEADEDNDSFAVPAFFQFLSITGVRDFEFEGEISSPDGDEADFVSFEFPNNANPVQVVRLELDCDIEGDEDAVVRAEIFEDGVNTGESVECNEGQQILTVDNTEVQDVRISFDGEPDEQTYVEYTLIVIGFI